MITQQPVRSSLPPVERGQGDRLAGYAGIAFVVLSIASFAPGRPPAFDAPVSELTRYASDKSGLLLASAWLSMLSLPALLLLVTRLRDRVLARVDGGGAADNSTATLARFFHGAYASALAIAGVAFIVTAVPAFEAGRLGRTTEAAVRFSVDLSTVLFALHLIVVTVAIATISLCVARTGALPGWVAKAGAVVALGTLTASLGVFSGGLLKILLVVAYMPGLLWWLAVSVVLLRAGRRA
jgi:hypothetical protein